MSTMTDPHPRGGVARFSDEQFVDLIFSDDELVQAEFDAIIAAEWPSRPPGRPSRDTPDGGNHDGGQYRGTGGRASRPLRPQHSGVRGWSRQRSPPAPLSMGRTE